MSNMARPLWIAFPGAFFHFTARGNERKVIFKSKIEKMTTVWKMETLHMITAGLRIHPFGIGMPPTVFWSSMSKGRDF